MTEPSLAETVRSKSAVRHLGFPPSAGITQSWVWWYQTRSGSSISYPVNARCFPLGE